jgi:hypothetical protein
MIVFCACGCTVTSRRAVFNSGGIVVTHIEETDYALKMSGHGGYILERNSAVVFGREYPILAGSGSCLVSVPERHLVLFVCAVPPRLGIFPDRELHIVHTDEHSDTAIPIGQSRMGDDFGAHDAGSRFSARVIWERGTDLRITTFDGRTTTSRTLPPRTRREYLVSLSQKKLLSETETPIDPIEVGQKRPNQTPDPTALSDRGSS